MTKPEPLKGCLLQTSFVEEYNEEDKDRPLWKVILTQDIKSAVEWLKNKEYILGYGKCTRCGNYHTYREQIEHKDREEDEFICFSCNLDEAFEDVTK